MNLIEDNNIPKFRKEVMSLFPGISEDSADYYLNEINRLWAEFQEYSHNKFKADLEACPKKIHSYRFEILTGLYLKKIGLSLNKTPDGTGRPDLLISLKNNNKLWIECCAPQGNAIPDRSSGEIYGFAVNPSLANVTSVLFGESGKGRQYEKRLSSQKILPEDYYIIALDGSMLETIDNGRLFPQIYEAVFPFTEHEVTLVEKNLRKNQYIITPAKHLLKENAAKTCDNSFESGIIRTGKLHDTNIRYDGTEAKIDTDFFKLYPGITGILFFPRYSADKPIFIQNPSIDLPDELSAVFPQNPLIINFLKNYDYKQETVFEPKSASTSPLIYHALNLL